MLPDHINSCYINGYVGRLGGVLKRVQNWKRICISGMLQGYDDYRTCTIKINTKICTVKQEVSVSCYQRNLDHAATALALYHVSGTLTIS